MIFSDNEAAPVPSRPVPVVLSADPLTKRMPYPFVELHNKQAHQLKSKRPRWCTYLQNQGIMLSPEAHKVYSSTSNKCDAAVQAINAMRCFYLSRSYIMVLGFSVSCSTVPASFSFFSF